MTKAEAFDFLVDTINDFCINDLLYGSSGDEMHDDRVAALAMIDATATTLRKLVKEDEVRERDHR